MDNTVYIYLLNYVSYLFFDLNDYFHKQANNFLKRTNKCITNNAK